MKINTNFFLINNKKSIVSLTTFTLLLFLAIILLISSISFYNFSKDNIIVKVHKEEVLNSLLTFRSDLLNLISINNSNLTYRNKYDVESIQINVNLNYIEGVYFSQSETLKINISSLGINFCSNYTFYPIINSTFNFNGVCVSLI